jgi:acetyl esterase
MPGPPTDQLADAELAAFVQSVRDHPGPSARRLGPSALREAQRGRVAARPPGPRLTAVEDLKAGPAGVPVRLYRPVLQPRPLVVFLHGGMWTIGDLESHDRAIRRIAQGVDAAELAVDFRRAPEHPWPAAVDDAVDVVRWAAAHLFAEEPVLYAEEPAAEEPAADKPVPEKPAAGPLVVAGDSSGGNLAALTCLRLRDEGGPLPDGQVLVCPNTDLTLSRPSVVEKGSGWGLSPETWPGVPNCGFRTRRCDPTRGSAHCTPPTSVACPPRWSSRPNTTRCAMRERPTPPGWPPPVSRYGTGANPG